MTNKQYDTVKNIALIVAPFTTLIIALLQALKIVESDIAIAISSAVDTFLGAIVIASKQIYDENKAKSKSKKQ